MMAGGVYFAQ